MRNIDEIVEELLNLQSRVSCTKELQRNYTDEQKQQCIYNPERIKQMEDYITVLKWVLGSSSSLA